MKPEGILFPLHQDTLYLLHLLLEVLFPKFSPVLQTAKKSCKYCVNDNNVIYKRNLSNLYSAKCKIAPNIYIPKSYQHWSLVHNKNTTIFLLQ